MHSGEHISVLLHEVIDGLALSDGLVVVDATINGGGHSEQIAKYIGEQGVLVGIDMDTEALDVSRERLGTSACQVILKAGNNRNLDLYLREEHIEHVDRFLFDLGMSSRQLDASERGFSFKQDEPLLMTFNPKPNGNTLTAREIINEWEEHNLADIIYGYGEERYARRIAKAIVDKRKESPIDTTGLLVSIIEKAVPAGYRRGKTHPATKTFQALRITVNDEMQSVREALGKARMFLNPGGRIVVITFHSIEDRIIKQTFKQWEKEGVGTVTTKKPIAPTEEEVRRNRRARSAKLRIFEKQ